MSNATNRVLVVFAHPALEKSRVQVRLLNRAREIDGVRISDLYEKYPDFEIDIRKEQQLLLDCDIIVWQHPFFWYSAPAILKQWLDMVLEHGWAYGKNGTALRGKKVLTCISSGGGRPAYSKEGHNRHTHLEYLLPFEQTANLCGMDYLPPFVVAGTHRMSIDDLEPYARQYEEVLTGLRDNRFSPEELQSVSFINDLVAFPQPDNA